MSQLLLILSNTLTLIKHLTSDFDKHTNSTGYLL